MHDLDPMNSNPGAGCVCPDDQNECDNTNPSPFLPTSPLPPHSPTLTPPPVALGMMEITVDKVEAHFPYAKDVSSAKLLVKIPGREDKPITLASTYEQTSVSATVAFDSSSLGP